jgi:tetratricopeptide (TPR) repeat protein
LDGADFTQPPAEVLKSAAARQRLLARLGRSSEALAAAKAWVALAERAGDDRQRAEALRSAARSAQALDRAAEAVAFQRQALARIAGAPDPALEADLLFDQVFSLTSLSDFVEAEAVLRRAEAVVTRAADARLTARLWNAWGTLRFMQGERPQALEFRERALEAAEKAKDSALLRTALTHLARSSMEVHDYARARALFERSLEHDTDSRGKIISLVSIGICHLELGQLEEAEAPLREAQRLAVALGNPSLEGWATGELGLVAWKRRDAERALAHFDRAIAICQTSNDRLNEAVWWTNKGMVRRDQQRFAEALVFYREAERLEGSIPGRRPNPNLRKHVGQCYAGLGRLAEAEPLFEEALAGATAQGDVKVVWETHRERARLFRRTGREAEAGAAYEAALAGIEGIRRSLRLEAFKTDFFESKVGVYAEVVDFVLAPGGEKAAGRAFELSERARARAFLDSLAEARTRPGDVLPAEIVDAESRTLREISRLQAAARRDGGSAELTALLGQREDELQALYLRVREEHPRFQELRYPEPARLEAVQRALPEGAALLAYFLAEPASHLWRVERRAVVHRRLPGAAEIEAQVRAAYGGLVDPGAEPALDGLSELLLPGGGAESLPDVLLIVPSGILFALPFEALPVAGRPLGERAATSYLPSASALLQLPADPGGAPPRLLALADPELGDETRGGIAARSAAFASLDALGALPHTRREARSVAAAFGGRASTLLLGPAANEAGLKAQDLAAFSVVHLATHGWIDPASSARSGLVLGDAGGDEDGLLQFREILRLPLRADLVTLSACRTALGEEVTGEGMVGLSRAFFYAGTPTVVASLWNVDDEASAELMRHFYGGLRQGLPKAAALRRARLELSRAARWRHPYFWAPFVLIGRGDDAVAVPARGSAAAAAAALLAVPLAAGWAWLARRRRRAFTAA